MEHLTYFEERNMLDECWRVLRKGGVLRIATPNLEAILELYAHPDTSLHSRYLLWSAHQYAPWLTLDYHDSAVPACLILNNMMHNWGHKIIYDRQTLTALLHLSGFEEIKMCRVGHSEVACFRAVEQHGGIIPSWANELETMVLEAVK